MAHPGMGLEWQLCYALTMTSLYLVGLRDPDPEIKDGISELFADDRHYVVNDTQIVVVKPPNGGKSIYERIKDKIDRDFTALIVRFEGYHGRHNPDLWSWLEKHGNQ